MNERFKHGSASHMAPPVRGWQTLLFLLKVKVEMTLNLHNQWINGKE